MVLDTLIVGAGLSGLSTALSLAQQPQSLLVAEQRDRVGGNITSVEQDGFIWEEGPTSFQPVPTLLELALALGLQDELVFADAKLPRYVYWQGRLRPVPMSPLAALTTTLLSPVGKLRALAGALGFVPPAAAGEETVADFFRRHLGAEVAQRLVAPFVSGVYAGDPQRLSAIAAFRRVVQLEAAGDVLPQNNRATAFWLTQNAQPLVQGHMTIDHLLD
ncbi:MAG: protoporphyrinogen oxidase [Spirulinaceae cyanobacterium RM2_2_10]|nr:protoporphyrinogen oxidase [Spirulinaceae cyanobacterium RM2_2_10]